MNHAAPPTSPPESPEPTSRPNMARSTPPPTTASIRPMTNSCSRLPSLPPGVRSAAEAPGSASPSISFCICATASEIPPAKSPWRNFGAIVSLMMRLASASGIAPSSP